MIIWDGCHEYRDEGAESDEIEENEFTPKSWRCESSEREINDEENYSEPFDNRIDSHPSRVTGRDLMENGNEVSRRAVLCGLAVLALGILPDSALAAGNVTVLSNGKVDVLLSKNPGLKKAGGVVEFQDGNGRALALIRTGASSKAFKAIDLSCTHQGVTVIKGGSDWVCPAHNSQFALDGKVKVGPARTALRSVPVKISATKITVG